MKPSFDNRFSLHTDAVTCLCYSVDSENLVSSSLDKSAKLWKLRPRGRESAQYTRVLHFTGHEGSVNCADFSPDGSLLASVSGSSIRLWTPEVKPQCRHVKAHLSTVRWVQFSPDGLHLATCSDDKSIKLFQVEPNRYLYSLKGHVNWIRCVKHCKSDLNCLASCSDDKTVKLWDKRTKKAVFSLSESNCPLLSLDYDKNGYLVAACGQDESVFIWDIRSRPRLLQKHQIGGDCVKSLAFHLSKDYLGVACSTGEIKILDTIEGRTAYTLSAHEAPATAVCFNGCGSMASGDVTGNLGEDETDEDDGSDGLASAYSEDRNELYEINDANNSTLANDRHMNNASADADNIVELNGNATARDLQADRNQLPNRVLSNGAFSQEYERASNVVNNSGRVSLADVIPILCQSLEKQAELTQKVEALENRIARLEYEKGKTRYE